MTLGRRLVRLYPGSLRDRWGSALEVEVHVGGWKSLPNVIVSILDMWLHPVVWPAASCAQRRRRAAVMALAIAIVGWLLGYVIVQMGTLIPMSIEHSWSLDASDIMVLLGIALVAPRLRFTLGAWTTLLRQILRRLALPLTVGVAVLMRVHLGSAPVTPTLRGIELFSWWFALTIGAIQVCHVLASLGIDVVVPPRPLRLRLGIWVLAAAFAMGGAVVVGSGVVSGHLGLLTATSGTVMLMLAIACAATLRDLYAVGGL
jgi:hypothetical protein